MSRWHPCIYCTEDLHCTKYSDDESESWCVLGPCTAETPSNGDKIRRMTDEELATWIDHIQFDAYERGITETPVVDYPNTYSGWLDWLKQEVSTNG